ncbi:MAG: PAAR domain-containing protein [Telluria sp.]
MPGPLIRLGDKTSHGGVVIEASPHSDSGGIPIARMGDKADCPIPGHCASPIISGDTTFIVDGKPAARHGDKTACGAVLIAGQQATIDNI